MSRNLCEQSLGVAVKTVNATLDLCRSCSQLESDGTVPRSFLQFGNATDMSARCIDELSQEGIGSPPNTRVLERVLKTSVEVWDKLVDTSLVGYITTDTLGDLDGVGF